jgi:hypothetical protein
MSESRLPTSEEIEALTGYLPRLYADGLSPVDSWAGGETQEDGSITMPYPRYNALVEEFFRLASSECWLDYGYGPENAWAMLRDEQLVKTASLSQIKTMLTYCVRGERFSDGHWAEMIEAGYIRRLLERLEVIRSELG